MARRFLQICQFERVDINDFSLVPSHHRWNLEIHGFVDKEQRNWFCTEIENGFQKVSTYGHLKEEKESQTTSNLIP